MKDYQAAAELYTKIGRHVDAAQCYLSIKPVPWDAAARAYSRAAMLKKALECCIKVNG